MSERLKTTIRYSETNVRSLKTSSRHHPIKASQLTVIPEKPSLTEMIKLRFQLLKTGNDSNNLG